jgi:hypothetical protein
MGSTSAAGPSSLSSTIVSTVSRCAGGTETVIPSAVWLTSAWPPVNTEWLTTFLAMGGNRSLSPGQRRMCR